TATVGSSPQNASLGLSALESALPSSPLGSSLRRVFPTGANLVTESATAEPDGMSSACAGFLSGDCANGKPQPVTLSLSLADLPGLPSGGTNNAGTNSAGTNSANQSSTSSNSTQSPLNQVRSDLSGALPGATAGTKTSKPASKSAGSGGTPNPLAGYRAVLTLSGPQAACTAGPPGSAAGNFTATQSLGSGSLNILDHGKSVLPNGPLSLSTGDVLSQLHSQLSNIPKPPSQLQTLLNNLPSSPLDLTINPGSTSGVGSGPVTTATAGELALSVNGTQVLDVVGAKATCGPNKAAAAATKPATTSAERPLGGGIQTDEGRSGSGDTALWLGVAGGVVLAGTAGGLTLWRRRA
ncbi:MAG: hypothetical protein J2P28_21060, partial [Actinobacteria bacterium]|nr:hypothetical protein [Actinomycetota bacterium]